MLIVLGYSFRDPHINRVILNSLAVPSFQLVVFGVSEDIDSLIRLKDPRITGLLSVVKVDLAKDLSLCRVYISSLDGYEKAKDILTEHGDLLERCAQYLMRNEKIDGADFYRLMADEIDLDGNEKKPPEQFTTEKPEENPGNDDGNNTAE